MSFDRSHFNPELESIRGLAAMAVVVAHAIGVLRIDGSTQYWAVPFLEQTPAQKLAMLTTSVFNADFAVVLFFVLSGYVLALSLMRDSTSLSRFMTRRFFRLIPPMWASVLLCALVFNLVRYDAAPFTDFFLLITRPPNATDIAKNLLLIDFAANRITWTMYVEAVGSLALPVFFFVSRRSERAAIILFVALAAATLVFRHFLTFRYLPCFQLGVILAIHPRLAAMIRPSIAVICAVLLIIGERILRAHWTITLLLETVAAYMVLTAVLSGALGGVLNDVRARFIGKISYSLYLFHPIVLCIAVLTGAHLFGILVLTIIGSVAIAAIAYRWIEQPSMALSRNLTRRHK